MHRIGIWHCLCCIVAVGTTNLLGAPNPVRNKTRFYRVSGQIMDLISAD